ncbi:hypothetical protein OPV22_012863 [Ensete ventricosum]|uniref:Uncharacterized protein n=1 Tax=Ensete ventricosum TaxID=4639 RepID=A0AAV8R7Z7_ENSVE|nr:hypothetical protein OPV22_012863 [Ensete ventricosum]
MLMTEERKASGIFYNDASNEIRATPSSSSEPFIDIQEGSRNQQAVGGPTRHGVHGIGYLVFQQIYVHVMKPKLFQLAAGLKLAIQY